MSSARIERKKARQLLIQNEAVIKKAASPYTMELAPM